MISCKKELRFYIMADRLMNGLPFKRTIRERLYFFQPSHIEIINLLRYMRMTCYYKGLKNPSFFDRFRGMWSSYMYEKISIRLGFSIGYNVFGYGLVIPHYGTIVINAGVRAGNYCVIHTSTCIGGNSKTIGNGLYLSAGAKIMGKVALGNGVSIAANSLVNKSSGSNVLLVGSPAIVKKQDYPFWWERDGIMYAQRVAEIENLKKQMKLNI